MKPKYWQGALPSLCDLCSKPYTDVMFDCRIPTHHGIWGNICAICFSVHQCKVGTGHGQRYEKQPDGRWLKTDG